jgi:hypothetical protein
LLSATIVIRPHRSAYVFDGVILLLTAITWVIAQVLGSINSKLDLILAWIILGGVAVYGVGDILATALAKVMVEGDIVHVRDRLGRNRRFARAEVSQAAMRSINVPRLYTGMLPADAFLLIGKDGRCLLRLPADDYDTKALERLVETVGLNWPHTENSSVRQINREFPGTYAFDYQTVAVAIMIVLTLAMAVGAFAVCRV